MTAVAGRPVLNDRHMSEVTGLADQGQISGMMKHLCDQGLVEDAQGHGNRQVKAWRLTVDGEAVIDAHLPLKQAQRTAGKGGKLPTTRSASGRRVKRELIVAAGPRRTRSPALDNVHADQRRVGTVVSRLGCFEQYLTGKY